MTPNPGEHIEQIAQISYQTQRFFERVHPKLIKFKSGRTVPFDQFKLAEDPEIGKPLPGYTKDDVVVAEIIQPSYVNVVKFVIAIGHHALLRNCNVTFMLENITRKASLHMLRYEFCHFNMQSQKYKNQGDFEYLLPGIWGDPVPPGGREVIQSQMAICQHMYEENRRMGLDPEWSRSAYPSNIAQTMTITTNFEQLRHMFDCLADDDYVWENRYIVMQMLKAMKESAPVFVFDYTISEDGLSAKRRGSKYSRNKHVNWSLPASMKSDFGIEVVHVPGKETDIE